MKKSKKNQNRHFSFQNFFLSFFLSFIFFTYAENQHPFFEIDFLEIPLCSANPLNMENQSTKKNSDEPIAETITDTVADTIDINDDTKIDHELRIFTYYQLCYRESFEQCEWAAYTITKEKLEKNVSRKDSFKADPKISTGSASLEDYRGSGYDRGHIAPAGDFMFNALAMSETFYMSNMSPQVPAMNRGIWAQLEAEGRKWAEKYGIVYIVTGPILENKNYKKIGINKVTVPDAYYKIFLSPLISISEENDSENYFAISAAYIIPNQKGEKAFSEYLCTIREIEEITGINFFYKLDDELEEKIETQSLEIILID